MPSALSPSRPSDCLASAYFKEEATMGIGKQSSPTAVVGGRTLTAARQNVDSAHCSLVRMIHANHAVDSFAIAVDSAAMIANTAHNGRQDGTRQMCRRVSPQHRNIPTDSAPTYSFFRRTPDAEPLSMDGSLHRSPLAGRTGEADHLRMWRASRRGGGRGRSLAEIACRASSRRIVFDFSLVRLSKFLPAAASLLVLFRS